MSRWRQTGDGGILSGEKLKDKKEREREKIKEGSEVTRSQKEPEAEASAGGGRVVLFGRLVDNTSPSSSLWSVVFLSPSLPLLPRS